MSKGKYLDEEGLQYLIQQLDARYIGGHLSANTVTYSGDVPASDNVKDALDCLKSLVDAKVTAVTGKGLSTNDYTTAEKNKLAGIASGAEVNVQSDWNQTTTTADDYIKNKPTIPTKTSQLTNDSGFLRPSTDWSKLKDSSGTDHNLIAKLLGTDDFNFEIIPIIITLGTSSTEPVESIIGGMGKYYYIRLNDSSNNYPLLLKDLLPADILTNRLKYIFVYKTPTDIFIGFLDNVYSTNKYGIRLYSVSASPQGHIAVPSSASDHSIDTNTDTGITFTNSGSTTSLDMCYDLSTYLFLYDCAGYDGYCFYSTSAHGINMGIRKAIVANHSVISDYAVRATTLSVVAPDPSDPSTLTVLYQPASYFLDYNNLKNKPTINSASIKMLDLTVESSYLPKEGGSISLSNGSTLYLYVYTEDDPTMINEQDVPSSCQYAVAYSVTDSNDDTYDVVWGCTTYIDDNTAVIDDIYSNGDNSMEYMENSIIDGLLNNEEEDYCICIYYANNVDYNSFPLYDNENQRFPDDTVHYNKIILTYDASKEQWSIKEV